MIEDDRLDHDLCHYVSYRPDISHDQFLYITKTDWDANPKLRKLITRSRDQGRMTVDLTSHDGVECIIFGPKDREKKQSLLYYFRKSGDEAAMSNHIDSRVLGSSRTEGESRLKYPFHMLTNIGDFFFVKDGKRSTIAVYSSNYTKFMAPGKMITVREVPGGVLVLLLWDDLVIIPPSKIVSK